MTKKISEMTEDEILELTDEDLEIMVKLRMAEEGIPLLSPPIEPAYEKESNANVTGYTCAMLKETYFENPESVHKVVECIKELGGIHMSRDYQEQVYIRYANVCESEYGSRREEISSEKGFTLDVLDSTKHSRKRNRELKSVYDAALKEYKSSHNDAKAIREEVYDAYNDVKLRRQRLLGWTDKLVEYLDLAEGNVDIAKNFFVKAYGPEEEDLDWVVEYVRGNQETVDDQG